MISGYIKNETAAGRVIDAGTDGRVAVIKAEEK